MSIFPNKAMVKAMPNAVPDHFTNRSPMMPRTTGNAAASPNPEIPKARNVMGPDSVTDSIIDPITASVDEAVRMICAEYLFNKKPTANLPSVKMAMKNVSATKAFESEYVLLSIR